MCRRRTRARLEAAGARRRDGRRGVLLPWPGSSAGRMPWRIPNHGRPAGVKGFCLEAEAGEDSTGTNRPDAGRVAIVSSCLADWGRRHGAMAGIRWAGQLQPRPAGQWQFQHRVQGSAAARVKPPCLHPPIAELRPTHSSTEMIKPHSDNGSLGVCCIRCFGSGCGHLYTGKLPPTARTRRKQHTTQHQPD